MHKALKAYEEESGKTAYVGFGFTRDDGSLGLGYFRILAGPLKDLAAWDGNAGAFSHVFPGVWLPWNDELGGWDRSIYNKLFMAELPYQIPVFSIGYKLGTAVFGKDQFTGNELSRGGLVAEAGIDTGLLLLFSPRLKPGLPMAPRTIPDNAFVRIDATRFDKSISEFGIQAKFFADQKVWMTQFKHIKHVTSAADFETMLYRQKLWPTTKGRFTGGVTIRLLRNVDDAIPAGITNMRNGVPQWRITRDIAPAHLEIIKQLK